MLDQVADYFQIRPDVDLNLMQPGQTPGGTQRPCLKGLDGVIAEHRPDCVIAQGDTTTVLAAATAAFYRRVPFLHVEAGLRTDDIYSPWPEEFNRRVVALSPPCIVRRRKEPAKTSSAKTLPRSGFT